jgi:hypothetical protein
VSTKSAILNFRIGNGESIQKRIIFTFYANGPLSRPKDYAISLTDPKDLFFHFNSEKITPSRFLDITKRLKIQTAVQAETTPFNLAKKAAGQSRRARQNALGFGTQDGAGKLMELIMFRGACWCYFWRLP